MLAIYLLRGEVLVRFCIWVAHPYVKECGSLSRPKTPCMNVKTGIGGCISLPPPPANDSLVISCRTGSISTSWQTGLCICASRSRSSLWRCIMKPLRLEIIASSTLKASPLTHTFGTPLICQSYLRCLNSLLLRFKSISFTGMTVSQFEAPFSAAKSTALLVFSGREFLRSSNLLSSLTSLSLRVVNCKGLIRASSGGSCAWDTICATRGAVTWRDIACSNPARSTGFSSPSPPFLTGSASSSHSLVVHVWPVIDGIRVSQWF